MVGKLCFISASNSVWLCITNTYHITYGVWYNIFLYVVLACFYFNFTLFFNTVHMGLFYNLVYPIYISMSIYSTIQ